MNIVTVFFVEIAITLVIVLLVIRYLRSFLRQILLDLCGTEGRAQFWTTFTNIVLLSLPMVSALGFSPTTSLANPTIAIAHQLQSNLITFMVGLIFIGFILLFFTSSASKAPKQEESKKA